MQEEGFVGKDRMQAEGFVAEKHDSNCGALNRQGASASSATSDLSGSAPWLLPEGGEHVLGDGTAGELEHARG